MKKWHLKSFVPQLAVLVCLLGLALVYAGAGRSDAETEKAPEPAKAAAASPAPKATYVGSDTCTACHEEVKGQLSKQFHGRAMLASETKGRGYTCEGCHGAGSVHANDPSAETAAPLKVAAKDGTNCMICHTTRLSPAKWQLSQHHKAGIGCLSCHGQPVQAPSNSRSKDGKAQRPDAKHPQRSLVYLPHADLVRAPSTDACFSCHGDKRAELSLPSHHPVKENRMTCADCHDPHAPMTDKIKRDKCITCHAKQQGPFRFEHGAISGDLTDACLDCHRAHGSPNKRLLKFTNRGLCLQCHADKALHFPGRQCWNCHKAVHGSNHDALLFTE
ncbi:MAG: cytochrome c3 family protein [Armatimonadota bacterium]